MKTSLLLLLVACGSSASKQPDAAPDVASDTGLASGMHYHYILDSVTWPTTSTTAREDGFDLNGDGTVDNQIAKLDSVLTAQANLPVQAVTTRSIDYGGVLMLADLQATSLTTATDAGYTMYVGNGANPAPCNGSADTTCRNHLTGSGTFGVELPPPDPPLLGALAGGVLDAGPGHLWMQLSLGGGAPLLYELLGAHVQLTPTSTNLMQGKIGGAITSEDVQGKLLMSLQVAMFSYVTRDCTTPSNPPSCGCITASDGETAISLFDANHDCMVTLAEIQSNALIMSVLQPDVTIEGKQCVSLGFAFTGVGATFTP